MEILRQVIFDSGLLMIIYTFITIAVVVPVFLNRSVSHAVGALVACAICLVASSTWASSFLARYEQQYSARALGGIAIIAMSLTLLGLMLMNWSGFRLTLYGLKISGIQWAVVGSVVGLITAKKALLK
jgi:hypothetical protein